MTPAFVIDAHPHVSVRFAVVGYGREDWVGGESIPSVEMELKENRGFHRAIVSKNRRHGKGSILFSVRET